MAGRKSLAKTPVKKSVPKSSRRKSSPKTPRKKSNLTNDDSDYEAERIIDHVTFEHAYKEYYVNNDERYENIFTTWVDNNRIEHDKFYYLIKWKNWPEKDTTWECEGNCSSMSYLKAYKEYNGLPKKCIRIRGAPCANVPGKLNIKEYEKKADASDHKPEPYGFYPDYKTYNHAYGIVRCGDFKHLQSIKDTKEVVISTITNNRQTFVLVERDMQYVLKYDVPKADSRNFENWQQDVQTKDRSYISSIIQHPNSVKMLDYYFKCKNPHSGKNAVYCYVYEYFEKDLATKIAEDEMAVDESKKMCYDMLSILSLLHTYGVHHNISKNHIYVDGFVYKLSHFENFRFFSDAIKMDEIDETTLYYSIAYRPLEPYASLDENKTTFDIYALGIVLLESLTNRLTKNDVHFLEGDLKDKLERLSEPHRTMVSVMLHCREYIHEKNIPKMRFTAKSLLQHPWLYSGNNFRFVKCVFLPSYYSQPIGEALFYEDNDLVRTVVDRLTRLYFDSENIQFQMFFMKDLETGTSSIHYIEDADIFIDKVEEFQNLRIVIVPILKAKYTEPVRYKSISFVSFPEEFGSVPIVIEGAPMSDMAVCRTVIEQAFLKNHRGLPFVIKRTIPDDGRIAYDYEMCPSSLINERLKFTFPKIMHGDEYAIPPRSPQYCITIKIHNDLENIQPTTSENVNGYHVCEFSMEFGNMREPRSCRFEPFSSQNEEADELSLEE